MRSTQCFGAAEVPQTANRSASASVDFPLPRGPIMQVRPRGMLTLKPGRKPPLISIFSTTHIGPTSPQGVGSSSSRASLIAAPEPSWWLTPLYTKREARQSVVVCPAYPERPVPQSRLRAPGAQRSPPRRAVARWKQTESRSLVPITAKSSSRDRHLASLSG